MIQRSPRTTSQSTDVTDFQLHIVRYNQLAAGNAIKLPLPSTNSLSRHTPRNAKGTQSFTSLDLDNCLRCDTMGRQEQESHCFSIPCLGLMAHHAIVQHTNSFTYLFFSLGTLCHEVASGSRLE